MGSKRVSQYGKFCYINIGQALNYWVYMNIFPLEVWATYAGSLVAVGLLLIAVRRADLAHFHDDSEGFGPWNALAVSAMHMMQLTYLTAAAPNTASSRTARLVLLVSGLSTYIVFVYFACDLTAIMTSGPADVPIRSFQAAWPHVAK